jgi:hypothetical protein
MVSKNSQTNCILFPLHFLITLSIKKLYHPPKLTNKKKLSLLGVDILPHVPKFNPFLVTMAKITTHLDSKM